MLFGKCNVILWVESPSQLMNNDGAASPRFAETLCCLRVMAVPALCSRWPYKPWPRPLCCINVEFLKCDCELPCCENIPGLLQRLLGDEQRELSGTDLFKAVRGRIRGIAQNEGEEKPEKSPWNGNWIYSVNWNVDFLWRVSVNLVCKALSSIINGF